MKAAILKDNQKHEITDVDLPKIGDEELLIEVLVCGLCASEIENWMNGSKQKGLTLGHEVVGIVKDLGNRVNDYCIGDRVTGYILNGFREYTKVHYSDITKVPESLTNVEALGEPIGCLVSGASRTPVNYGDKVSIIGTGFMGLGFLQLMSLKGAGELVAIDVRKEAAENALSLGATSAKVVTDITDLDKVTEYGVNMEGGSQVVCEVSGKQGGLTLAGEMTSVHGVLSIVGFHQNGLRDVDMELWNWKAITVVNAHERRQSYMMKSIREGLELIRLGKLDIHSLITHEYKLEEIDQAFHDLINKPEGYVKAVVVLKE